MTETIQQLKEDIAVLQEKLNKLEEAEKEPDMMLMRQGNVDIVDYDHKVYYRIEYTDSFSGVYVWFVRRRGEDSIRQVRDVNVYGVLEEYYQKQVLKQKEEYPYKKDEIEWDEKDNPKTLLQIIREWCDDDNDPTCEELLNRISGWLPVSYDEPYGDYGVGWNDCLNEIKEKLK